MNNAKIALTALIVVVALMTLFVRIPLPSRGYFNFGDVAVVFSGLVLGRLATSRKYVMAKPPIISAANIPTVELYPRS